MKTTLQNPLYILIIVRMKLNKSLIATYVVENLLSNSMLEGIRNTKEILPRMNEDERKCANTIIKRVQEETRLEVNEEFIDEVIEHYIYMYENEHDTREVVVKYMFVGKNNDCYDYEFFAFDKDGEFIDYMGRENLSYKDHTDIENYASYWAYRINEGKKERANKIHWEEA